MKLEIFNVEHGQCALLTGDSGEHMLIDCGHHASKSWRPSRHLYDLGVGHVDTLIISNFDEDHASDLPNLRLTQTVGILYKNPTVNQTNIVQIKNGSSPGSGISELCKMIESYYRPVQYEPYFSGLKIHTFWNSYSWDMTDSNNLSLVTVLQWPGFKICFPGDMGTAGWKRLLLRDDARNALNDVDVLVAPHHGRGRCDELFSWTGMQPKIVVISDGSKKYETQETGDWYRSKVSGVLHRGQWRYVISTRADKHVRIDIAPSFPAYKATLSLGSDLALAA